MKKVLIIGYMWPYHLGSGARIPKVVDYLLEFGWEPIVLTAPLAVKPELKCRIIETLPHRDARRLVEYLIRNLFRLKPKEGVRSQINQRLGAVSRKSIKKSILDFIFIRLDEIVNYPDFAKGWKSYALKAANEIIRNEDIKLIMSTSPPIVSHLIARQLKLKYKIPWVADLCHLWSQNNGYPYSFLRRIIDERLELKTLSEADALVTVSEPLVTRLRALHRGKPVYSVAQGFDPVHLNMQPARLSANFTITYTGSLHRVLRKPSKLFTALQNLITREIVEPYEVEVRFYGPRESWVDIEIEKCGLSGIVKQCGIVPLNVSLEKQKESHVLCFLMWGDSHETGVITSKIFEYLAAMRPILAIGEYNDVVNELLTETGAGVWAQSVEDVECAIERMYQEYKLRKEVVCHTETAAISKYSRPELAKEFSRIFESVIQESSHIISAQ